MAGTGDHPRRYCIELIHMKTSRCACIRHYQSKVRPLDVENIAKQLQEHQGYRRKIGGKNMKVFNFGPFFLVMTVTLPPSQSLVVLRTACACAFKGVT